MEGLGQQMKPKKIPTNANDDKLKYYKGQVNLLKKEIKVIKERLRELEKTVIKLSVPKEKAPEKTSEEKRQEILRRFSPNHFEDSDD